MFFFHKQVEIVKLVIQVYNNTKLQIYDSKFITHIRLIHVHTIIIVN